MGRSPDGVSDYDKDDSGAVTKSPGTLKKEPRIKRVYGLQLH